jgi:DNA-binding Xre family transcriptional regulator
VVGVETAAPILATAPLRAFLRFLICGFDRVISMPGFHRIPESELDQWVGKEAATDFDVALGARVRARRRARRLSQSELGERLDIILQQVQRYETSVDRISVSSLIVIADVLQCSVNELLLAEPSASRCVGRSLPTPKPMRRLKLSREFIHSPCE